MDETVFRKKVQDIIHRIFAAFEDVDPDLAECEESHGSLSIHMADKSRCILSVQPSVRQIWLAVAARGVAFHFSYDATRDQWSDDKGKGIEILSYLKSYLKEAAGLDLKI